MKFDGKKIKELEKALLSAYPARSSLERMLMFELDENLNHICSDSNHTNTVFELIKWSIAHGKIDNLIEGANSNNSGNELMKAFYREYKDIAIENHEAENGINDIVKVKKLLSDNKLDAAIDLLINLIKDNDLCDQLINLKGRLRSLSDAIIRGEISFDNKNTEEAKIRKSILLIIKQIQD